MELIVAGLMTTKEQAPDIWGYAVIYRGSTTVSLVGQIEQGA